MKLNPLYIGSEKLVEAGPSDRLSTNNFSYREILSGENVVIHGGQQMLLREFVRVEGLLKIDGEMMILDPNPIIEPIELPPDNFNYYEIALTKIVNVPESQQMVVRDTIKVDGFLRAEGFISVGNTPMQEVNERLPSNVLANKLYNVKTDEEYYFRNTLKIDGQVRNDGFIAIGA